MFRFASVSLVLLVASSATAQQPNPVPAVPVFAIELDKVQWKRNPAGGTLEFATPVGDRGKVGMYIQLVRWPPNTINKAHSHPDDRYAVVLSGTFYHGYGEKFDEAKLEIRRVGTFFTEPARLPHFGMTKGDGTILYFVGTGPSTSDSIEK